MSAKLYCADILFLLFVEMIIKLKKHLFPIKQKELYNLWADGAF